MWTSAKIPVVFVARLTIPEGELVLEMKRFHEFSPCQDGGIAAYLYEHGDAGCGDTNWPKTFVYVAGWGYGQATLNKKVLYEDDHEMHFMLIQGVRDRHTLQVQPYSADTPSLAGGANPATSSSISISAALRRISEITPGGRSLLTFLAWK